ncbi:2-hydroxy-3-oxopropionate reductase [Phycisphaerae bacterium RAS1]|nr:2-hydroxy-3-oxopropionate reductase [Phycisphaerae bacterium RAS1]
MGAPMAGHLLRAGHRLAVHSRTRARAEPLLRAGAAWCESPAETAAGCDVLCICVTDTPDVEQVLFAHDAHRRAAADALRPGAIVIDFSTISPEATRRFASRLGDRGIQLLDAPVTGGDVGARNATLTIMVGGDAAAFERVRPILDCLGRKLVRVGDSGSGQTLKACNQVLCGVNMIAVCEALTLAQRSGLELTAAIDVLSSGAGGSWALANLGPRIVADDLKPAFTIKLIQKDLRIVQEAAAKLGINLPGVALAQERFGRVEQLPGGGELGTQGMIRAYR